MPVLDVNFFVLFFRGENFFCCSFARRSFHPWPVNISLARVFFFFCEFSFWSFLPCERWNHPEPTGHERIQHLHVNAGIWKFNSGHFQIPVTAVASLLRTKNSGNIEQQTRLQSVRSGSSNISVQSQILPSGPTDDPGSKLPLSSGDFPKSAKDFPTSVGGMQQL